MKYMSTYTHTNTPEGGGALPLPQSEGHVLSDGVSFPPADEAVQPLKRFQGPVLYVLGLPGSAIPLINAAWVPTSLCGPVPAVGLPWL